MALHKKEWSLVEMALGNDRAVLEAILDNPCINNVHSITVSQFNNLQLIKEIQPGIRSLFIKPTAILNPFKGDIIKINDSNA